MYKCRLENFVNIIINESSTEDVAETLLSAKLACVSPHDVSGGIPQF
jgi:hypothetical protein